MVLREEVIHVWLGEKKALQRARIAASLQSLLIFLILVSLSEDYQHNQYMQAWMSTHIGGFGFLLNGTLAAFYAGLMITYYLDMPAERTSAPRLKRKELMTISTEAN